MNINDILNDVEEEICFEEEELRLRLERCDAKREVLNDILSRLDSNKGKKNSTRRDAVEARAYRALCRRA